MKLPSLTQLTHSQKKVLIRAGAAALFFLFFASFVIIPNQVNRRNLSQEVTRLQEDNQRIQGIILTTDRSGEKFQQILSELGRLQNMAPPRETISQVMNQVASTAERFRLNVLSLRPSGETPIFFGDGKTFEDQGRVMRQLDVEIKATGSFFALGRYLHWLEKAPYKIIIKNVDVKNQKVDATRPVEVAELEIDLKLGILMMCPPDSPQ